MIEDPDTDSAPMPAERAGRELFQRWEGLRQNRLIVIATRPEPRLHLGDCVRHLYEHLRELPQRPLDRLDVLFVGRGLATGVASRLVSLLREFTRELTAVVTGTVGPGETLACIAADQVLMHPLGTLTTALDHRRIADPTLGLDSLAARVLDHQLDTETARLILQSRDAEALGISMHNLSWTQRELRSLCALRLNPPSEEHLTRLLDAFTRERQTTGEPVARKQAREIEGLKIGLMNADTESLAFEIHTFYESRLALRQRNEHEVPQVLIESLDAAHQLAEDGDWSRVADASVH